MTHFILGFLVAFVVMYILARVQQIKERATSESYIGNQMFELLLDIDDTVAEREVQKMVADLSKKEQDAAKQRWYDNASPTDFLHGYDPKTRRTYIPTEAEKEQNERGVRGWVAVQWLCSLGIFGQINQFKPGEILFD